MDNENEIVSALALSDLRDGLLLEFREVIREEEQGLREKEKASEQGLQKHLVKIELGTVLVAVIAIFIMHRMELDGLAEVGTLIPSCLLAVFRIIRT